MFHGLWRFAPLMALCALSACGGGRATHRLVVSHPQRSHYRAPGPASDPWGPYISEAAQRFDVPQRWVRAVMRQESGGHQYRNGRPITSDAGAAGLMQIMPPTYAELRDRYGLGPDPWEPHDNIVAGTGYIRALYDRYGAPAFLAAYNAGPQRLEDYNAGRSGLPNETINYLAAVAPQLGTERPLTGPLVAFVGAPRSAPAYAYSPPPERQGFGNFLIPSAAAATLRPPAAQAWGIQVGAFVSQAQARQAAEAARALDEGRLGQAQTVLGPTSPFGGAVLYRARLVGLDAQAASAACQVLRARIACIPIPPGT